MSHTPGPWRNDGAFPRLIVDADGNSIARVVQVTPATAERIMSDARLIAAAPDMAAALAQIERLSREADRAAVDVPAMLGDIARAALARAV